MSQVSDVQLEMKTAAPAFEPGASSVATAESSSAQAETSKAAPFTLLRGETALALAEKYKLRRDQAKGALHSLLICFSCDPFALEHVHCPLALC
jgi:hypothetical protein